MLLLFFTLLLLSSLQQSALVTDLSNSSFVVCQTQQEDAGLVHLDGHRPATPLHLAHGGRLLSSGLSDQSLGRNTSTQTSEDFWRQQQQQFIYN